MVKSLEEENKNSEKKWKKIFNRIEISGLGKVESREGNQKNSKSF